MKIALFGGSFNPIHNGHLKIAEACLEKKLVNEVWFIPCGNHAFNKSLASTKDRIAMINLAIENNPKMKVNDLEVKRRGKSYTIDTLRQLKAQYSYKFYLIIGSDNLYEIEKWHNFPNLIREVEFILISRPGYNLENKKNLKIYSILTKNLIESSTHIRNYLKKGISIKNLVSEKVEKYIENKELYK